MRNEEDFSLVNISGVPEETQNLCLTDRLTVLMGYGQLVRMEPHNSIYHLKLQKAIEDLLPNLR